MSNEMVDITELRVNDVMDRTWHYDYLYPSLGVYINDIDDDGEECSRVVLAPNPNFDIDTFRELCKRICEEHNPNVERAKRFSALLEAAEEVVEANLCETCSENAPEHCGVCPVLRLKAAVERAKGEKQ